MMTVNDYLDILSGYKAVTVINENLDTVVKGVSPVEAMKKCGYKPVRSVRADRTKDNELMLYLWPDECYEGKAERIFRELGEDAELDAMPEWEFVGDSKAGSGVSSWIYCPDGLSSSSVEMGEDGGMVACLYDADGMLRFDEYVDTFEDGVHMAYKYIEDLEDEEIICSGHGWYYRSGRC